MYQCYSCISTLDALGSVSLCVGEILHKIRIHYSVVPRYIELTNLYGEARSTQESAIRFETGLVICFPIGSMSENYHYM